MSTGGQYRLDSGRAGAETLLPYGQTEEASAAILPEAEPGLAEGRDARRAIEGPSTSLGGIFLAITPAAESGLTKSSSGGGNAGVLQKYTHIIKHLRLTRARSGGCP